MGESSEVDRTPSGRCPICERFACELHREVRPLISFGDALLAYYRLRPEDSETQRAIVEMLGLASERSTPAPVNIGAAKVSSTDRVEAAQRRPGTAQVRGPGPLRDVPRRQPARTTRSMATVVTKIRDGDATIEPPEWLATEDPLGPLEDATTVREPVALFGRLRRRGILTAAVAALVEEGDVDIETIVADMANGQPIRHLPRKLNQTTRLGVQVLLDRGKGMAPFRQDQDHLVAAFDDILGEERFSVHRFVGCPSRGLIPEQVGGTPSVREKRPPWMPPPPGTPIVAITDLGIGGPIIDDDRASPGEWMDFADRLKVAGHRLIGLVPYEASRWPPRVARSITLLHWSERTTAGEVRHAVRDARRRLK